MEVMGDEAYAEQHTEYVQKLAEQALAAYPGSDNSGSRDRNDDDQPLKSQWNDRVRLQAGDEIILFNGTLLVIFENL
jgi:hypothetical protein